MEHPFSLTFILVISLGVGAQWLAWQFRLPAIVLFAVVGVCAGPVFGWLHPSTAFGALLDPAIGLAVGVILFEGGLNLKVHEFRETAPGVKRLVSLGVLLSWLFGTICAVFIGNLSWPVSLLFAAIMVVTGPTVILPLLRQAKLARRPASVLKWEGIINDPIGALLAVLVYEYFVYTGTSSAVSEVMLSLALAVLVALGLGAGGGFLLGWAFRRDQVPEFLKAPVILCLVLLVYGGANTVQTEAGLLATTVLGVVIGNLNLAGIEELRRFKEYISVLLVSGVFIVLTADLDLRVLSLLNWSSIALLLAILFLVRPAAVLISTIQAELTWRERLLVAWIAPRGIVAAATAGAFAPRLVASGYADAELLVPLTFAVIFVTMIAHGFSIGWLARRLGLASASREGIIIIGASAWTTEFARNLQELGLPVLLVDTVWHRLQAPRLAGIPVHYGEILSELSDQTLDLTDMGYLLAATDNDAYNAFVCTRFAPEFERSCVFQFASHTADADSPKAVQHGLQGQAILREDLTYEALLRRCYQGWTFQKTPLTEAYGYEAFLRDQPPGSMSVFVLRPDGNIQFFTPTVQLQPQPGDLLLSFSPARALMNSAASTPLTAEPSPQEAGGLVERTAHSRTSEIRFR